MRRLIGPVAIFAAVGLLVACSGAPAIPSDASPTTPPASAPAASSATTPPSPPASNATATPTGPRRLSGNQTGNQEWSGEILVTGDVRIRGDLTIQPGTTVRFLVQDDNASGNEIPADGHNDRDPTRLASYATSHADIFVFGRLTARGTTAQPITFTSAAAQPRLADWQGVGFAGDGSILEYVVVEWSRNGLTPQQRQPASVIRNSIIRHAMWGCISSGGSGMQIIDNDISDCGHEGVDIKGGSAIVRGNKIRDSYGAIVVLEGSPTIEGNTISNCGDGIAVLPPAKAGTTLGQNSVTLAPPGTRLEWRYGDFAYRMFERP